MSGHAPLHVEGVDLVAAMSPKVPSYSLQGRRPKSEKIVIARDNNVPADSEKRIEMNFFNELIFTGGSSVTIGKCAHFQIASDMLEAWKRE